jgi:hypothetical protein
MNWKGSGRKRRWPNWSYYIRLCLEELRRTAVKIVSVTGETRTGNLRNTCQIRYRLSQLALCLCKMLAISSITEQSVKTISCFAYTFTKFVSRKWKIYSSAVYRYFPNAFFLILDKSLALMFMYCKPPMSIYRGRISQNINTHSIITSRSFIILKMSQK